MESVWFLIVNKYPVLKTCCLQNGKRPLRCFAAAAKYLLLKLQDYPPVKQVRKWCLLPLFLSYSCKHLFLGGKHWLECDWYDLGDIIVVVSWGAPSRICVSSVQWQKKYFFGGSEALNMTDPSLRTVCASVLLSKSSKDRWSDVDIISHVNDSINSSNKSIIIFLPSD